MAFTALFYAGHVSADEPSTQHDDNHSWLDDDGESRAREVNEGGLVFIAPVTDRKILHSDKVLTVSEDSLETGWVHLKQCYFNISPVDKTDIVYRYKEIRHLTIASSGNMGKATVEGQVVQLEAIAADAFLCVTAEVNIIENRGDDTFVIHNGPYYQQFLDGYYPYHVSLTINFPEDLLAVSRVSPAAQPLFNVRTGLHRLSIDTWFEGVLEIEVEMQRKLISDAVPFNQPEPCYS